ncbi:HNH endonuclease [Micromonospora chalcea]|uniref:HNH endonuclease n=1 Tax=Micromonospora chalcea TaxID=1874 RepID=UPI0037F329AC
MERTAILPASEGGCWLYQGGATKGGYGALWVNGKQEYVHRLMAAHHGMDIDGATVDHLCFSRNCVRPSHLMVCSREENTRRMKSNAWRDAVAELMDEMNGSRN